MSLDDEEDNDLYGSSRRSPKRVKCASCGDLTSLGVATGDRAKAGLCVGCFKTLEKQSYLDRNGVRRWKSVSNTNVKRTPFDGGRGAK